MRRWINHHRRALNAAFTQFLRAPWASLAGVLVIGLSLSLPLAFYLTLQAISTWFERLPLQPELSLFLRSDVSQAQIAAIESELTGNSKIASLRFVSKDQALRELGRSLGEEVGLDELDSNPLPDAFVVRPKDVTPTALDELRKELQKLKGVDQAQVDTDWAARLTSFVGLARRIAWALALGLSVALLIIVGSTIRLQLSRAQEEVEVARLIGANDAYVRRPLLYFGALQGLLGALIALGIVVLAVFGINRLGAAIEQWAGTLLHVAPLAWRESGLVLASAAGLGWLAAFLAARGQLKRLRKL